MTRFKKELRKRGMRLECDYDYLPYEGLETVQVDSENTAVHRYFNFMGWETIVYGRNMEIVRVVYED